MREIVKAAIIVSAAITICTAAAIYFNPYHSCMRTLPADSTGNYCIGK